MSEFRFAATATVDHPLPPRIRAGGRWPRVLGTGLAAIAMLATLSLATWSAADPSLTHLSTATTSNAFGPLGAIFADLMITSLGTAGIVALLPVLYWSCQLLAGQSVARFKVKLALAPLAVLALAAFFSSLPKSPNWPLASGYGGNIGDLSFSVLTSLAASTSTDRAGLLAALVALVAGLGLMALALGLTRDDLKAMAQLAKRPFEPNSSWVAHLKANVSPTQAMAPLVQPDNVLAAASGVIPLPPTMTPETTDEWLFHHGAHADSRSEARRPAEFPALYRNQGAPAPSHPHAIKAMPPHPASIARAMEAMAPVPIYQEPSSPPQPAHLIHRLPPAGLLAKSSSMRATALEMSIAEKLRADRLTDVLAAFAVTGEVREHITGPVVTTFLFEPQAATKTARVLGLGTEIAKSLSVPGVRLQLGAGRASLVIEVPHEDAIAIGLRDLVEHPMFGDHATCLPLALGSTSLGQPAIVDLAQLPAVLVAGGSVDERGGVLRALVGGLAYRHTAERLTLAMIDATATFGALTTLPHCEGHAPAVSTDDALRLLAWATDEIDARTLRLRASAQARTIETYNARNATPMPYLVVVIDDLAQLAKRDDPALDYALHRLVKDGAAVGVHVIAASARADAESLPERLCALFSTRVALKMPGRSESRAFVGETGAEDLLGRGDALVSTSRDETRRTLGGGSLSRLHTTCLSLDAAAEVTAAAQPLIEPQRTHPRHVVGADAPTHVWQPQAAAIDAALYERAITEVCRRATIEPNSLGRSLGVGYVLALAILARMAEDRIVTEMDHEGRRRVLIGRAA